ncbi:hypothetical protein [Enterococcus sp. BWR-S5]|uniref:hypothetical protein n=1 Tax=Enterococcus sp. BWR-S5 TaxID=2787714 RepID=UPI0019228520|nr:hypothetical protein [Enterococcus sp. BWR-S5]MBL1226806.1 hypothetical protein [Enterococcus sp. BWR-S5]
MFEYIGNSDVILDEIGSDNPFHFSDIMKIEYNIEENIFNEKRSVLLLDLKTKFSKKPQVMLSKFKFNNVSELSLKEVTNIDIYDRLIIKDMKNEPMDWPSEKRYHVHDDSGYGENDGYNYINFYCESIEAIGLEEFPYEDF